MIDEQFKEMGTRVLVVVILAPFVAVLLGASFGIFFAIARAIIKAVD